MQNLPGQELPNRNQQNPNTPKETAPAIPAGRFERGLRWEEFLAGAAVNRDKFEQNYRNPVLTAEDRAFFQKAGRLPHGPGKLLAIGEAWCGDVYRELPTAVHIAESAGIELRIFLRDENPDLMDKFLSNGGKSRAIPILAFYTKDMEYIAHFTERSTSAHAGLARAMDEARAVLHLPPSASFGNLADPARQDFLREVLSRIEPFAAQWRRDAVREIRQLLAAALRLPDPA